MLKALGMLKALRSRQLIRMREAHGARKTTKVLRSSRGAQTGEGRVGFLPTGSNKGGALRSSV
jgi:hypothetical protein